MKTKTTILLCIALISTPLHAEEEPPRLWFHVLVLGAAVVIVGSAILLVKKCDDARKTSEKCVNPNCGQPVKRTEDFCQCCGTAARCGECDTKLPKDATSCPSCGEKVPSPQRTLTTVQMSTDGVTWTTVVPPDHRKLEREMTVLRFKDMTEFNAWKATNSVVSQVEIPMQQQALFRLVGE